jgi:hypothetical protein
VWLHDYQRFVEWFCRLCFSEPYVSRQVEFAIEVCAATTGEVLARTMDAGWIGAEETRALAGRVRCPVLVIHGDADLCVPHAAGAELARATGGRLVTISGGDHGLSHEIVKTNLLLREALVPPAARATWRRPSLRPRRALFLSSPFGLGHARRDLAIADELRRIRPDITIEWLAQHPVTELLEARGERVHPASADLASEAAHVASCAHGHTLDVFAAAREMDEIMLANFMVFHDVTRDERYDLWIGDEALDVDYFLHENPELKIAPYAWLTDWVGYWPMAAGGEREALLAAEYNDEMLAQTTRNPRLRDAAIFVGDLDDIPAGTFGPGLPQVHEWASEHYEFAGYVTAPDQPSGRDHHALRAELGFADAPICIVAVGGSGVGEALLERSLQAFAYAQSRVPNLQMLAVTGPRIDPGRIPPTDGVEAVGYVDGLHRYLAACDVAVVQGGLSTTMELVAASRPFVYVPLERHFEQFVLVRHRLERHGAGSGLAFADATPKRLGQAIVERLTTSPSYRDVPRDGAARASALIARLV